MKKLSYVVIAVIAIFFYVGGVLSIPTSTDVVIKAQLDRAAQIEQQINGK